MSKKSFWSWQATVEGIKIHWNSFLCCINFWWLSEHVYFIKVEGKEVCEQIMTDTYGHKLNSRKNIFRGSISKKYDQRS